MGVFSKYNRFREAGEQTNVYNAEQYGEPARSLFTSAKILTLHKQIDITDDREQPVYQAKTKFPSLLDKTDIVDAGGQQVAHIERKFLTLHERHYVTMADGTGFELSTELFHLVKNITNIEGLGWQLRGNIMALNFQLYDREEQVIAVIGQKMLSMHDKYCIDLYQPQYEKEAVAILITLQHIIRDRANRSSSSSASFSSN